MNIEEIHAQVGDSLLEVLVNGGVIRESKASIIKSGANILTESDGERKQPSNRDVYFVFSAALDDSTGKINRTVGRDEFFNTYNILGKDRHAVDVLKVIPSLQGSKAIGDRQQVSTTFNDLVKWYNSYSREGEVMLLMLKDRQTLVQRRPHFVNYEDAWYEGLIVVENNKAVLNRDKIGGRDQVDSRTPRNDEPVDDISLFMNNDPYVERGTRNRPADRRSASIVTKLNDTEMMAGELYNDISRIPRPAVYSWLKLVKKDIGGFGLGAEGSTFSEKRDGRIFIIGYQTEPRMTHEVWYHTKDETFGVYDIFGNIRGKRYYTMNETIRGLIQVSLKFSKEDAEFFKFPANYQLAQSFFRGLDNTTDEFVRKMQDREHRLADEDRAEAEKKLAAARKKAEDEEARKSSIRSAASRGKNKPRGATYTGAGRNNQQTNQQNNQGGTSSNNQQNNQGGTSSNNQQNNQGTGSNQRGRNNQQTNQQVGGIGSVDYIDSTATDISGTQRPDRQLNIISIDADKTDYSSTEWAKMAGVAAAEFRSQTIFTNDVSRVQDIRRMQGGVNKLYQQGEISATEASLLKGFVEKLNKTYLNLNNMRSSGKSKANLKTSARSGKNNPNRFFTNDELDKLVDLIMDSNMSNRSVATTESLNFGDDILGMASAAEKLANASAEFSRDMEDPSYRARMDNEKSQFVSKDTATFAMIRKAILGTIIKYGDTRLKPIELSRMLSSIGKYSTSRGFWNKVKKFFMAETERAEFIGGYSVNDRIFFEVWYIAQADVEAGEGIIASYFLFDVTNNIPKVVRGNMPYLRHAEQAMLQKVGVFSR